MTRDEYANLVHLRSEVVDIERDLTALVVKLSNALTPRHESWMPVFEKLADARHALQDAKSRYTNALDLEAAKQ